MTASHSTPPDHDAALPDAASPAEQADFARGQAILADLLAATAALPPAPAPSAPALVPPVPAPPAPLAPPVDITPVPVSEAAPPVTARVEAMLARIEAHEGRLAAFTLVMADAARREAGRLDALTPDRRGPLHGLVLSVKDVIDVEGVATSCCSRARLDDLAGRDAPLVARLKAAGAVIIGKANCHEFAFGGPAFDLPFPPARNPWDASLFPGGSSSGSGVSVAAGFCDVSIGTDTAGSIRLPASHCGVVGLKLTHGAVPMAGVRALSPTLDSVGPLARSVADCMRVAQVMMGAAARGHDDLPPMRLLVPEAGWLARLGCEQAARAAEAHARAVAGDCGLAAKAVALPALADIHAAASVMMMHEVAAQYAAEVRGDFTRYGEVFRNRALLGEDVGDADAGRARAQCARLAQALAMAIGDDVLMLPGHPLGPTPLETVDKFYFLGRPNLNIMANAAGMPVLSLPVMLDAARRPFGIQLMARRGNEARLLQLGQRLEAALAWQAEPILPA